MHLYVYLFLYKECRMKHYVRSVGMLMIGVSMMVLGGTKTVIAAPLPNDVSHQQMADLAQLQNLPTTPSPGASSNMGSGPRLGFGRLTPGPVGATPLPAASIPSTTPSAGAPAPMGLPNVPTTMDGLASPSQDMGMQSPFAGSGALSPPNVAGGGVSSPSTPPIAAPGASSDSYQHTDGVLTLHNAVQVVRFADPKIPGVWCYLVGPKIADNLLARTRSGGNIAPQMTINCIVRPGASLPEDLPGAEPVDAFSSDSFVVDRVWDASTRALLYVVLDLNRTADGVPLASSTILSLADVHTTPHSMFEP